MTDIDGLYQDIDMDSLEDYTEKLSIKYAELDHVAHDLYNHLQMSYVRLSGDMYFAKSRDKIKACLHNAEKVLGA